MKITGITIKNIAGYHEIVWEDLHPYLNILVGKNGVGKSTVLQSIYVGLNALKGDHKLDSFTNAYPEAVIELRFKNPNKKYTMSFSEIHSSGGKLQRRENFFILEYAENRVIKNAVGKGRSRISLQSLERHNNVLSTLRALHKDELGEIISVCSEMPSPCSQEDWNRIILSLPDSGPRSIRPASCGQYDVIAYSFDIVQILRELRKTPAPVFILFDNPDAFLHPEWIYPVINLFKKHINNCQIIIASHSLKLLAHRKPRSVFWMDRKSAQEKILSVRNLDQGSKEVFFSLYGTDVNSAVLHLLYCLETPEYYHFLLDSALPPESTMRPFPSKDRQMKEILNDIPTNNYTFTLLDFGCGHGDLLIALSERKDCSTIRYIAYSPDNSDILSERLNCAIESNYISKDSLYIHDMNLIPSDCDRIVLCNACHEILPPDLPEKLAQLVLNHLKRDHDSKIIIHEAETLTAGEKQFLMWYPDDFIYIFNFPGCSVQTNPQNKLGVPLDTTILTFDWSILKIDDIENTITKRFIDRLPEKREHYLNEIQKLWNQKLDGYQEAIRQRRLAFYVSQIPTILILEEKNKLTN